MNGDFNGVRVFNTYPQCVCTQSGCQLGASNSNERRWRVVFVKENGVFRIFVVISLALHVSMSQ